MSRSYRFPAVGICFGGCPRDGKRFTSREIRAAVRVGCQRMRWGEEIDLIVTGHLAALDVTRGTCGTRDADRGWSFFADGRTYGPFGSKLCRK